MNSIKPPVIIALTVDVERTLVMQEYIDRELYVVNDPADLQPPMFFRWHPSIQEWGIVHLEQDRPDAFEAFWNLIDSAGL